VTTYNLIEMYGNYQDRMTMEAEICTNMSVNLYHVKPQLYYVSL